MSKNNVIIPAWQSDLLKKSVYVADFITKACPGLLQGIVRGFNTSNVGKSLQEMAGKITFIATKFQQVARPKKWLK